MKKIATLCLVLVLVLGATGVGFAKWSETLKIEGVVETGEVDVQLSQCTNDPGPDGIGTGDVYSGSFDPKEMGSWMYAPGTCTSEWTGERYDKNVGSINCVLVEDEARKTDPNDDGPNVIQVTITNAYPSYYGNLAFDIENIGTVPVKVESIQLLEVSEGEMTIQLEPIVDLIACETWFVSIDEEAGTCLVDNEVDNPDDYEFSIHLSTIEVGTQIDPTPENDQVIYGDICVHVEQAAEELETYDFQVAIVCSQWNEVP